MRDDLHYMGLLEVSERIRRRELSSVAVTEALLKRIERHESKLNSILLLLADSALAQARKADKEIAAGFWRGPLHGVAVGVKDNLWTKDSPTSSGMAIRKHHRFDEDATVIKRLAAAGAVLLAKLHMTEGAKFDHDPKLPRPNNPWSAKHWTGVSSSGAAVAVAAGFCYGAVATDSGGSIRMPSSATSVTGLKPTWGRVSRYGLYHCTPSFDTLGTLARSASDAAALLQVITGSDPNDVTALSEPVPNYSGGIADGVGDLTIGIDWSYATGGLDEEVGRAVRNALDVFQALGARVREVKIPWGLDQALATMPMIVAELTASHAAHFPGEKSGGSLTGREDGGPGLDALQVVNGYQERDRFKAALEAVFRDVDLILAPGLGEVLPTWDGIVEIGSDLSRLLGKLCRFTAAFNLATVPTLSLPGGFTEQGLPIGIQLAGRRLAEIDLVRAGAAFQRATDYHVRRPPLD